jgi:hypothetical protein
MKFKDKISFLTYVTSPENYGDLTVELNAYMGSYGEIVLAFKNSDKELPARLYEKVYSIIDEEFLHSPKIEYYNNIDYQKNVFSLVDGVVDVTDGHYSTIHSYEEDEIENQLKELLDDILYDDYSVSLTITGTYKKYNKEPTLLVEEFYLGIIDENDNEIKYDDVNDYFKNRILDSVVEWAVDFSESSSSGEYVFESYSIQLNECGRYEDFDSSYYFGEESNSPLLDISVLQDKKDEVSEEVEIDIS